jgi:hypothetical protein
MEFSAAPVEGLKLTGGIGYDHAHIVSPGSVVTVPAAGAPIQNVAPLTGNFSAAYQHPLGPHMHLVLRGDYSYVGHSYSVTNSPAMPRLRPAYALVNLRTGVQRGPAEYAVFIKNLGDVHPNLGD